MIPADHSGEEEGATPRTDADAAAPDDEDEDDYDDDGELAAFKENAVGLFVRLKVRN